MAVVENYSTEIGDILVIKAEVPILGLVTLTDFIDNVTGETASKYFTKTFRYSIDGINFSEWIELTTENVAAVDVEPTNAFKVEYRYERAGTDTTGQLAFDDVTLDGTYTAVECGDTYSRSIFAEFFSCSSIEVLEWCLSVLEKIYKPGIVPEYIIRGSESNINWEDRDYLDFWRSITCYFAVIVTYARLFGDFTSNKKILEAYLQSKDFFVCTSDTIFDLVYIANNLYDEMRKRGTQGIALQSNMIDDSSSSLSGSEADLQREIDGELYRLVCWQEGDEFLFCNSEPWKCGWVINKSSPLYRGINDRYNANKSYEMSQDVLDLSKYPLYESSYISLESDGTKQVMRVKPSIGSSAGFLPLAFDLDFAIPVDPSLDYEFTCSIRNTGTTDWIYTGVLSYTKDGNNVTNVGVSYGGGKDTFLNGLQVGKVSSQYYYLRGIIYNSDQALLGADGDTGDGFGSNLKFGSDSVSYIIPFIFIAGKDGVGEYYIWDIKVRPRKTNFSTGCVSGSKNYLLTWLNNRSPQYSDESVTRLMKEKLIPYNSILLNTFV